MLPAISKAGRVMPMTLKIQGPAAANSMSTPAATVQARRAVRSWDAGVVGGHRHESGHEGDRVNDHKQRTESQQRIFGEGHGRGSEDAGASPGIKRTPVAGQGCIKLATVDDLAPELRL